MGDKEPPIGVFLLYTNDGFNLKKVPIMSHRPYKSLAPYWRFLFLEI